MNTIKRNIFLLFSIPIIFFVTYISIGDVMRYYFFTDDYATLYHTQNNYSVGWPYVNLAAFFYPFYKLFGTNPTPYFIVDFIIYFIVGILIFILTKLLTKSNFASFFTSLIFATGYICIDQFTQAVASTISNFNLVLMILTLIFTILWADTGRVRYYILAFIMFWISMIIIPVRSFPLVMFIPTTEFILIYKKENIVRVIRKLFYVFLRFIPFLLLGYSYGVFSYGAGTTGKISDTFNVIHSKILFFIQPSTIKMVFDILGKSIFIEPVVRQVWPYPRIINYPMLGFILLVVILLFSLYSLSKLENSRMKKSLLILVLLSIEGFIGFLTVSEITSPTNRYLVDAKIGLSGIVPLIIYIVIVNLKKKKLFFLLGILFLIFYIYSMANLSKKFEDQFVTNGLYASKFYTQLKRYLPELSKGDIIYVDYANRYPVPSRLGGIMGSALMSQEVNLAFPYHVKIDSIKVTNKFNDIDSAISQKAADLSRLHTFYYDEQGLHDTTTKTLGLIKYGKIKSLNLENIEYNEKSKAPNLLIKDVNFPSLIPSRIMFALIVNPLKSSDFIFPFSRAEVDTEDMVAVRKMYKEGKVNKDLVIQYLLSQKKYYETVHVEVSSQDNTYVMGNLINDKVNDSWVDNENKWLTKNRPWIIIDLGEERKIGRIVWVKAGRRIPTEYKISFSTDKINWKYIDNKSSFRNLPDDSRETNEIFSPINARYVKFDIFKTENENAPGVSEVEVIEDKFTNVDRDSALRLRSNPFEYVENAEDMQKTYEFLSKYATLSVFTKTNKDEKMNTGFKSTVPIFLDGLAHDYQLEVPAGGTMLDDIQFRLNFPAELNISSMQIESFPVKDISK